MRKFRNKKTGKIKKCDEQFDKYLIKKLENDPNFKELMII